MTDVINEMVEIHNLRLRIQRLNLEGGELAQFGPAREPSKVGIDEYKVSERERSPYFKEDPTGRRTGNGTHIFRIYNTRRSEKSGTTRSAVILKQH